MARVETERIHLIVFLTLIIVLGTMVMVEHYTTTYHRDATVIEIKNSNEIKVEDEAGNVWSFYGDNYTVGQTVTMTMNTNHTDNYIKDDVIEKVKTVDNN